MNGTRIASGSTGNCRAIPTQSPGTLVNSREPTAIAGTRVSSTVEIMAHLLRQANAWIDISVEDIDDEIDHHDHDPCLHDNPLHEREIALEDPLVEQPADPGPSKDHLDDHRRVDHHDEVDAGQGEHWDQRVFERVHGEHDVAGQALQTRQLDIFAAQYLEHA